MPDNHGRRNRIQSLFRRPAGPTGPGSPAALAVQLSARSQVSRVRNPSSEVGPEPVMVPVTGHSILLELAGHQADTVVINDISAEITGVAVVEFDGVARTMSRMPDIIGSPDMAEAARRAVDEYRPLEAPHFQLLLDHRPPIVQPAQGSTQPAVELPFTLRPKSSEAIYLAPVTDDSRVTSWNLCLTWTAARETNTLRWPFMVTADTGSVTAHPDGTSIATPIRDLAPDHWCPGWGDEARYAEARHANDWKTYLHELLGLTVLLPRTGSPSTPMVSRDGDEGFVWVFTSRARMLQSIADQGVDSYEVSSQPFIEVLQDLAQTPLGFVVDPNTELNRLFRPAAVAPLLKHHEKVIAHRTRARGR